MPEQHHREQAFRRSCARFLWLIALLWPLLALSACGKKPNEVDPPPGAEDNIFPKTYPNISTDPKP
jgi:hypothetical protein